ncbi:diacylglycerol kinase [Paraglaciecola polaris]|uniref:Diacylglycerol kinase n=2 Tax=Paraglaciecola TaxID=1621534 RepID=K6ZD70_9ALTE|nr:diacylglycerol kinase [Paraglaciecola polaris LMG 21857]|tara:strand:- start:14 stop:406 length:393 start_codon:yes stop_codon:yes gene_type:complete
MLNDSQTNTLFDANAKPRGFKRIYLASKNSLRALIWLFINESAFRQECLALVIAIPITFLLNVSLIEQTILISVILFVILCEILNTAIEVIVDRIGLEMNTLSGLAKDLGSAAVTVSILLALITWAVICI